MSIFNLYYQTEIQGSNFGAVPVGTKISGTFNGLNTENMTDQSANDPNLFTSKVVCDSWNVTMTMPGGAQYVYTGNSCDLAIWNYIGDHRLTLMVSGADLGGDNPANLSSLGIGFKDWASGGNAIATDSPSEAFPALKDGKFGGSNSFITNSYPGYPANAYGLVNASDFSVTQVPSPSAAAIVAAAALAALLKRHRAPAAPAKELEHSPSV